MRHGYALVAVTAAVSLIAVAGTGLGRVAGGPFSRTDCYVEFDGITVTNRNALPPRVECMDGEPCDADGVCGNGFCSFPVRLCINQKDPADPACRPPTFGLTSLHILPPSLAELGEGIDLRSSACGAFVDVPVGVRGGPGRVPRPGRLHLRAIGRAASGRPTVDPNHVVLVCLPRPPGSPCATTTTTTVPTTTSTAPASTTTTTSMTSTSTTTPSTTSTSTSSTSTSSSTTIATTSTTTTSTSTVATTSTTATSSTSTTATTSSTSTSAPPGSTTSTTIGTSTTIATTSTTIATTTTTIATTTTTIATTSTTIATTSTTTSTSTTTTSTTTTTTSTTTPPLGVRVFSPTSGTLPAGTHLIGTLAAGGADLAVDGTARGGISLSGGSPGPDGAASLTVASDSFVGVQILATTGPFVCIKVEAAGSTGKIDCNGGTPVDVSVSGNSHGTAAPATNDQSAPVTGLGSAATAPAGAGFFTASVRRTVCPGDAAGACVGTLASAADCNPALGKVDYSKVPAVTGAFTTGTATATIAQPAPGTTITPTLSRTGVPFSCASWTENGPGVLVVPAINFDPDLAIIVQLDD